ncbi:hypothetical protein [Mycolicibacterium mengxianglii]|uniref:hypothetical protein n=1 Tax=Mycolicibacterium mengxianglii TaxID=2736649 RepID=UPI0018EF2B02|nr:hypothetical protein [Mycolicibacterium mengxianglii]
MVAPSVTRLPGPVVRVADRDAAGVPGHDEILPLSAPLSDVLGAEFDGALASLGVTADALLLAALGRAVARTLGTGVITVDIADGDFAGGAVSLYCTSPEATDANTALLDAEHLLALSSTQSGEVLAAAEVALSPTGAAPVKLSATRTLQLCASRHPAEEGGILQLDWWYDSRRFDGYTVEELAEQFGLALVGLCSEAVGPLHGCDTTAANLAFVG